MGSTKSRAKTAMRRCLDELIGGKPKLEATIDGMKIKIYLATCTPDLAARVIEHCTIDNRKVRQNKVAEWVREMKAGHWVSRSTVEFFESGRLHDGQHRFLACADSGVPAHFQVQVFSDADAVTLSRKVDTGVPRNLVDYMHFHQVHNSERTTPMIVLERNYRIAGNPFQPCRTDRSDYLKLYREIGEESVKAAFDLVPKGMHRNLGIKRDFVDWFALQGLQIDPEATHLFLSYLVMPEGLRRTDPMFVAHMKLKNLQMKKRQHKNAISTMEQAVIVVKAWNMNYDKESVPAGKLGANKLRYRISEDWPHMKGFA